MYNFQVEDLHTYHVSGFGVLVHNAGDDYAKPTEPYNRRKHYVTKPFKLLELLSRIRALIRRNAFQNFVSSDLVIDTNNMTVKKNNQNIFVTKTEFQILSMLIRNNGAIVTRSSLLQSIWDDSGNFIDDNTLSVHVSRLREKIGADKIATVRGIGYRWEENI